jgi:hypothetical protein
LGLGGGRGVINVEFILMRDIAPMLPSKILPCNVDWGISVRGELVDVVRLLFSGGEPVGRLVEGLFIDSTHAEFFMRNVLEGRRYVRIIVFSQNYLGVSIEPPWMPGRDYVIGVNDYRDGLFINELDLFSLYVRNGIHRCYNESGSGVVIIATASDSDFRKAFDYDVDVLSQEAVLTTGRYRVQGEVVFELTRADDKHLESLFKEQVALSIANYMADRIMRILIDQGFNPSAEVSGGDVYIIVPGALADIAPNVPKDDPLVSELRRDFIRKLGGLFASILGGYFTVMSTGDGSMIISDETAVARVDVDVDSRLSDVMLRVTALEAKRIYNKMVSEIISNVKDMLNNSERIDELMIGNHYIRVERGLPINFEYEPEPVLKPRVLENLLVAVSIPRAFLVTPRSLVVIEHPQHGSRRLRFDGAYDLRVTTTAVSDRYVNSINSIVLRRLAYELGFGY